MRGHTNFKREGLLFIATLWRRVFIHNFWARVRKSKNYNDELKFNNGSQLCKKIKINVALEYTPQPEWKKPYKHCSIFAIREITTFVNNFWFKMRLADVKNNWTRFIEPSESAILNVVTVIICVNIKYITI